MKVKRVIKKALILLLKAIGFVIAAILFYAVYLAMIIGVMWLAY